MKNPIKNYFQSVYNKTHKKPFTFLNCFLCIFVPVIGLILGAYLMESSSEGLGMTVMILSVLVGWVCNFLLLFAKFKVTAIGIFFLNILASIAFFCKLILVPFIKFLVKVGVASTQANLGNTTASVNASSQAGEALANAKISAFNWFVYDGYELKDTTTGEPEIYEHYELDEGSYTYAQNQEARNLGFSNGKDAEMAGRKWNGNGWV